jgi:hypothetical protein
LRIQETTGFRSGVSPVADTKKGYERHDCE